MLYREIIAVCSEIHTKHINTLRGQKVEFTRGLVSCSFRHFHPPPSDYRAYYEKHLCLKVRVIWNVAPYWVVNKYWGAKRRLPPFSGSSWISEFVEESPHSTPQSTRPKIFDNASLNPYRCDNLKSRIFGITSLPVWTHFSVWKYSGI